MIRPLLLISAILLLLASCIPGATTAPNDVYASQNYAQQISEHHFRHVVTFADRRSGKKRKKAVVPTQAGKIFLFEESRTIKGKIQALYSQKDKKDNAIVHDETARFEQAEVKAPAGWDVRLKAIQTRFDFDPSVKAPPELSGIPIRVDMGGKARASRKGVIAFIEAVEISVPKDAQPGRYLVKAEYKYRDERKPLEFIVEVL